MEIGRIKITFLDGGRLRLGWQAMFDMIPRVLWEHVSKPDAKNRIDLATTCLLVEGAQGGSGRVDQATLDLMYRLRRKVRVFEFRGPVGEFFGERHSVLLLGG